MKPGSPTLKQKIAELSPENREKLEQYAKSIKEIKKEIYNMLNKPNMSEQGGNMTNLHLNANEE